MTGREPGAWIWLLGLSWLIACSDSHSDPALIPDASTVFDAGAPLSPPLPRSLTSEEAEWAAATDFEIEHSATTCYGSCPVYKMTLRASGEMRFTGYDFVWRPGTYEMQRPAADVSKLYADLILRGFLSLKSEYLTSDDGCLGVATDYPSTTYALRAGGREKIVKYDEGCEGDLGDLTTLKAMKREIIERANLGPLVENVWRDCPRFRFDIPSLRPSYVLRNESGDAVGLLRFNTFDGFPFQEGWIASTCDGQELAKGDSIDEWSCGKSLHPPGEDAFKWPGIDAPQSGLILNHADVGDPDSALNLKLRLFTVDTELTQTAEQGDVCP